MDELDVAGAMAEPDDIGDVELGGGILFMDPLFIEPLFMDPLLMDPFFMPLPEPLFMAPPCMAGAVEDGGGAF